MIPELTAFAIRRRAAGFERRAARLARNRRKVVARLAKSRKEVDKYTTLEKWVEETEKKFLLKAKSMYKLADRLSPKKLRPGETSRASVPLGPLQVKNFWRKLQP